ncbi:hypothetical protein D3C76_716320 [compost metagenome]
MVLHVDRRLERQHANEVHGPDSAGQASGADPAPKALGRWFLRLGNPFGHIQCGKTASAGDQKSQQHQERVMCAMEYDLSAVCQLCGEMQTKPLHSVPRGCLPAGNQRWRMCWSIEAVHRTQGIVAHCLPMILEWALVRLEIKCRMGRVGAHGRVSALRIITDSPGPHD